MPAVAADAELDETRIILGVARRQLLTSEQQLRDARHLLENEAKRHDQTKVELARTVKERDDLRNCLIELEQGKDSECASRSEVEGELYARIQTRAVESVESERQLETARFELARTVQTSHDREAALIDAITAITRSSR